MEALTTIPYDTEQRRQVTRQALFKSAETLEIPAVRNRLGRYAAELHHTLQHIAAPPIQPDGHFSMEGLRDNTTPLIALHIGEVALRRPRDLLFNRVQRRHIRQLCEPKSAQIIIDSHRQHHKTVQESDDLPYFEQSDIMAFVYAHHSTASNGEQPIYLRSRPVVALNLDADHPTSPINLLHELTHVMQMNRKPIDMQSFTNVVAAIRRELEGYFVSAQIIRGYQDAGMHTELLAEISREDQIAMLEIDMIRAQHQAGGSTFGVSDGLVQNLIDRELNIIAGDLEQQWNSHQQKTV